MSFKAEQDKPYPASCSFRTTPAMFSSQVRNTISSLRQSLGELPPSMTFGIGSKHKPKALACEITWHSDEVLHCDIVLETTASMKQKVIL